MLISLSKMIFLEKGSLLQVRQQVGEGREEQKRRNSSKKKNPNYFSPNNYFLILVSTFKSFIQKWFVLRFCSKTIVVLFGTQEAQKNALIHHIMAARFFLLKYSLLIEGTSPNNHCFF